MVLGELSQQLSDLHRRIGRILGNQAIAAIALPCQITIHVVEYVRSIASAGDGAWEPGAKG